VQYRPVRPREDLRKLEKLFDECLIADGHAPLGESKYLDVIAGKAPDGWVAEDDGVLVAYIHRSSRPDQPRSVLEAVFQPARRAPDAIKDMLMFVIGRIDAAGGGDIRVWVYHPVVAAVVDAMGFELERELLQMRMSLPVTVRVEPNPDVSLSAFSKSFSEAWVTVNNRAFAGHPENGSWTAEMLEQRTQQPWFDAGGLLMAWHDERLVGFCWTKMHSGELGEIYVVGVDPPWQGRSLGKQLTVEGLRYLHERRGATTAMLYVDRSDTKAVGMYQSIGFLVDHVDQSFIRSG
jgi:mycothiol synthase